MILIRNITQQVKDRLEKSKDSQLADAAGRLTANLSTVEDAIYQVKNQSSQDPLNYPIRLNDKIGGVLGTVLSGDFRPTKQSYEVFDILSKQLQAQLDAVLAALRRSPRGVHL